MFRTLIRTSALVALSTLGVGATGAAALAQDNTQATQVSSAAFATTQSAPASTGPKTSEEWDQFWFNALSETGE